MALTVRVLRHTRKKTVTLLPCICTIANALCGLMALIFAFESSYGVAAYCIIMAWLFDICDGRLARKLGSTSVIGKELDSLADAVSFCVAPVIILYSWRLHEIGLCCLLPLGIYMCSGLVRLAHFNTLQTGSTSAFVGMPTPLGALFFAALILCASTTVWASAHMLTALLCIIAGFMLSSCHFSIFKGINNRTVVLLLVSTVPASWILVSLFGLATIFYGVVVYILANIFLDISRRWRALIS